MIKKFTYGAMGKEIRLGIWWFGKWKCLNCGRVLPDGSWFIGNGKCLWCDAEFYKKESK